MATFHLTIKSGKRGSAANHSAYIAREHFHGKGGKGNDMVAKEHGNLPEWANNNPSYFWDKADQHERANGAAYREYEIALPIELTQEQRRELVKAFIEREIKDKPYQYAIHMPKAALGTCDQPHAHIMFSDRKPDGLNRIPEKHFSRHDPINPKNGGCKKDSGGLSPIELREQNIALRANWANLQNQFLEENGHAARVDHRSHKDRGIETEPERHLGLLTVKKMTVADREAYNHHRAKLQTVP